MDEDVHHLLRQRRHGEALEQLLERYETKLFLMALAVLNDPARAKNVTRQKYLPLRSIVRFVPKERFHYM